MIHVDVSNTSYYKELATRNIVVLDGLHVRTLDKRQSSPNESDSSTTSTVILDTDTGLPLPFDTSLGSNFTDTACPDYFTEFLADSTFLSCLPVSLLLQNSMSFFQAVRSTSLLEQTLDTSCAASLAVCSPLMDKFADNLIAQGNCQDDYQRENPLVMQAYAGLKAYEPLYQATCLKDASTEKYCFVEAMESSSADDSYPYYTGVGLALPQTSEPQCTTCLKQTMDIFAGYAEKQEQPLSETYLGCATRVNTGCGESFANTQIQSVSKVASTSGTSKLATTSSSGILLVALLFAHSMLS
ncbi:hypothetical protein OHC33_010686 [Knufia fluminis]|uniref:DUF7729 domain-containing protein n=1 Tax=Knufia fluminis TaxID=191047 RepID=A0AAN8EDX5_9EURO|nr:hypothetical protein OHC33_010686 [Knufia fluminis]